MLIKTENDLKQAIANEKAKIQQEKARNHAQATQEIYDDINKTLKEKYSVEMKAKLNEISTKLKKSFEDKFKLLENQAIHRSNPK